MGWLQRLAEQDSGLEAGAGDESNSPMGMVTIYGWKWIRASEVACSCRIDAASYSCPRLQFFLFEYLATAYSSISVWPSSWPHCQMSVSFLSPSRSSTRFAPGNRHNLPHRQTPHPLLRRQYSCPKWGQIRMQRIWTLELSVLA